MVKGTYSAAAVAEVVVHLRKSRLSPIKVEEASGLAGATLAPRTLKKGRIKADDIQAMTTELAIMMRAGLSLDNSLKVLVEMSHKVEMRAMLQSVLESVKAGMPLSQALGKHHDLSATSNNNDGALRAIRACCGAHLMPEARPASKAVLAALQRAWWPSLAVVLVIGVVAGLRNARDSGSDYYRPAPEAAQAIALSGASAIPTSLCSGWAGTGRRVPWSRSTPCPTCAPQRASLCADGPRAGRGADAQVELEQPGARVAGPKGPAAGAARAHARQRRAGFSQGTLP
ncbi:hypothetical protein FQR65_LT20761 [Abscondita terminalis]|nr:hypothetical protein FQR65_LT20761 [Abscondita terminalis]